MSMGYGGKCTKVCEDNNLVLYTYTCYNSEYPESIKNSKDDIQGEFEISTEVFKYPYIIETKRVINKTKQARIHRSIGKLEFDSALNIVKSCKFDTNNRVVRRLFYEIIDNYIKEGIIPKEVSINM